MANVSRTIDVIFNGKDFISKTTKRISDSINKLATTVNKIADPIADATDKLIKMETALVAVGAAIATISLAAFKNYEYALIDLKKVLAEDEIPLLQEAQKEIERLAILYGQSATDLINSTTDFKRAGFTLKESLTLVNSSLELSSAGMVDLGEATNDIIAIMKGFEFEVSKSTKVVDVINVVSDKYATNATELSNALRRVAPAAHLAGISLEETAAVLTPAIEVFRSGEEAGTAWRRGLIKLTDDAAPVREALSRLGVAQREGPNKELRKGRDILYDLAEALKTTSSSNQQFAISQIFGNRQASKMIQTLTKWDYAMGIKSVAAMVDHQYTLDQVKQRWASFEVQLGASSTAITLAAVALGEKLKPAATSVLGAVTELFATFRDSLREGAFDTLFTLLDDFGVDLADYLLKVGSDLPKALQDIDYSAIKNAFSDLFDTIKTIVDRFQLDTPEGLRQFLQDVIDTSAGLVNVTTGLLSKFDEFGTKVLRLVDQFKLLTPEQQKQIGAVGAWGKVIDKYGSKAIAVFEIVNRIVIDVSDTITKANAVITHIVGIIEGVLLPLTGIATLVGGINEALYKAIWEKDFKGAFQAIGRAVSNVGGLGKKAWKDTIYGLDEFSGKSKQTATDFESHVSKMSNAGQDFDNSIESVFNHVVAKSKTSEAEISDLFKSDLLKSVDATIAQLPRYISIQVKPDAESIDPEIKAISEQIERSSKERSAKIKFDADIRFDREAKDFIDLVSGAGKYTGKKPGVFTDEDLTYLEGNLGAMRRELALTGDAVKDSADVELDVPDDTKFKAAQDKLLKEIEVNGSVMEASMAAAADMAEARAQTIASAFEAVNSSVTSTGDVLSSLFSSLSSGRLDIMTQSNLQRQISLEEERRQEAFDLQKQLTTAQIDLIKQRAAAMASGDPIVTVSGDGLQPHLEAFMWEILSAIQVRVNEDYGSFLLGIGAA